MGRTLNPSTTPHREVLVEHMEQNVGRSNTPAGWAEETGLPRPSVRRLLAELLKEGRAERRPDPKDPERHVYRFPRIEALGDYQRQRACKVCGEKGQHQCCPRCKVKAVGAAYIVAMFGIRIMPGGGTRPQTTCIYCSDGGNAGLLRRAAGQESSS